MLRHSHLLIHLFWPDEPDQRTDIFDTWSLLSYVTPQVIRSELSRAVGLDDTGRVAHFEPRILLPRCRTTAARRTMKRSPGLR